MRWIEEIRLRTLDYLRRQAALELLRQLQAEASAAGATCAVYHHATIETDVSIHLVWRSAIPEQGKSAFGAKLDYLLREFGDVDYSIWVEKFYFTP